MHRGVRRLGEFYVKSPWNAESPGLLRINERLYRWHNSIAVNGYGI